MPSSFASFELIFYFAIESPDPSAYAQLLDELDRLTRNADSLALDAEQCVTGVFREAYAGQMTKGELEPYRGDDGQLSDELILAAIEPSAIILTAFHEGVGVEFCFHSKWDDEHGLQFELEGGSFARPWRNV